MRPDGDSATLETPDVVGNLTSARSIGVRSSAISNSRSSVSAESVKSQGRASGLGPRTSSSRSTPGSV
jgi:N-acetylmuramic acid 6-phosphate (MurNAc-6-P) etherase